MSLLPNSYDYQTWDKYITALRGKRITLIAEIPVTTPSPEGDGSLAAFLWLPQTGSR
jgi:hypothetical protein